MTVYTIALHPPPILWAPRDDLAALYAGPTHVRVRAESTQYACVKARAMIPWRLNPVHFNTLPC